MGRTLPGLEALRGLAALTVVAYHVLVLMHVGGGPGMRLIQLGWIAVMMFFVLSAFVLVHRYDGRLGSYPDLRAYALRRLFRIAPLFYLVIAAKLAVISWLGGEWPSLSEVAVSALFVNNLVYGWNGSVVWGGWSISVEMIFYLALPLLLLVTRTIRQCVAALLASLLIAGLNWHLLRRAGLTSHQFSAMSVVTNAPFFVAGILAYRIAVRFCPDREVLKFVSGALLITAAVVFAAVILLELHRNRILGVPISRYMIGLLAVPVVIAAALYPWRALNNPVANYIGDISYGLFLWHPICLVILQQRTGLITAVQDFSPWPRFLICFAAVTTCAAVCATTSLYLVENPLRRWGRAIASRPAYRVS